jgi:hypothetical protein
MIQSLADVGEVVRNATVFQARHGLRSTVNETGLLQAVEQLFALLAERQVDAVLVGGIALLRYVEGRNTEDIDFIIALPELKKLPEVQLVEQSDYFAQGRLGNLKIDFLLTRNRLFDYVRRRMTEQQAFGNRLVPCATVDGLLLLKLYALPSLYQQGNFGRVNLYEGDIAALMQAYRPDMAALWEQLRPLLNEFDLTTLQEIVAEIQRRIERFDRGLAQ